MKQYSRALIVLILCTSISRGAEGPKGVKTGPKAREVLGTPTQTILDINNVTTWARNDGFFDWVVQGSWNGTFPKGTIGDIFSQGIVWGGFVHDGQTPELRVGGSIYRTGSVAGAILTDGSGKVTGREDPGASGVRIFRVRPDYKSGDLRDDAANLLQKQLASVTPRSMTRTGTDFMMQPSMFPASPARIRRSGTFATTSALVQMCTVRHLSDSRCR
ncbi:MAG: hypothetical protein E6K56_11345 [Ignavibacteria bacterium]|nr:MAG: hypothetical protein E6K56_11345 [Ignavibacteria bacterium]